MNGRVDVFANHALTHDDRIFVVVSVPGHKGNQHILTEREFTVLHCGTVGENIAALHPLTVYHDRFLVEAGARIGTAELREFIRMFLAFIIGDDDLVRIDIGNRSRGCRDAGYDMFHAGSDKRAVRIQQRHCLSLHVGAHEGTGAVVVFEERNAARRDRNDLTGRDVRVVDLITVCQDGFTGFSRNDPVSDETAVHDFVGLRDHMIVFLIRRHVFDFIGNFSVDNLPVRGLDKSVFIHPRIGGEIGNETDIRTFRCLDRTHSTIMGMMDVTDFKSGTLSGKPTRPQCGKSSLMGQFS